VKSMLSDNSSDTVGETCKGEEGTTYIVKAGSGCQCKGCKNSGCIIWYILHVTAEHNDYPVEPWNPYVPYIPYVPHVPHVPHVPSGPYYNPTYSLQVTKPQPSITYEVSVTMGDGTDVQC
jgi:hypothetical protein